MNGFKGQFTRVKDLSDRRRLPLIGRIRLGVKAISKKSGKEVTYPKETDYFVCPPEVQKIYGPQPKELEVMFPLNDIDAIFPQRYVWFGSTKGVKCTGNGEIAMRIEEPDGTRYEEMEQRECPCELLDQKKCKLMASLFFILPKISLGGVYQINTSSFHSIVDINSSLSTDPNSAGYQLALIGRINMVPLKLRRIPRETHGSGGKETHFTMQVIFDGTVETVNALRESTNRILSGPQYALPAPVLENPALDEGATVEVVEDDNGDDNPTPEEEQKALEQAGMLEPPKTENVYLDTKPLIKEVYKFTDDKELQKWFNANSAGWNKQARPEDYADLCKIVNSKLAELRKKGK